MADMFVPTIRPGRSVRLYYRSLDECDRRAYEELKGAMCGFYQGVVFDDPVRFDTKHVMELVDFILKDHPSLFWINRSTMVRTVSGRSEALIRYNTNSKDIDEIKIKMDDFVKRLFDERISHLKSEYEVEKAVHDYLIKNISYSQSNPHKYAHTLVGPLLYGEGVCEGIAQATNYLLNCYGVKASSVSGTTSDGINHMWNVVVLDGKAYHLDVTYDLECNGIKDNHKFFNLDDAQMLRDRKWSIPMVCEGGKYGKHPIGALFGI